MFTLSLFLPLLLGVLLKRHALSFPPDDDSGAYLYDPVFHGISLREIRRRWFLTLLFPKVFLVFLIRLSSRDKALYWYRIASLAVHTAVTALVMCLLSVMGVSSEGVFIGGLFYALLSSSAFYQWWNIFREHLYLLFMACSFVLFTGGEGSLLSLFLAGFFAGLAVEVKIVCLLYVPLFILDAWWFSGLSESGAVAAGTLSGILLMKLPLYVLMGKDRKRFSENTERSLDAYRILRSYYGESDGKFRDVREWMTQNIPVVWGVVLFLCLFGSGGIDVTHSLVLFLCFSFLTFVIWYIQGSIGRYSYFPLLFCGVILTAVGWDAFAESYGAVFFLLLVSLLSLFPLYKRSAPLWRGEDVKDFAGVFEKRDQYAYLPALGEYLREKTSEDERIFVWGSYPQIYLLAEREGIEPSSLFLFKHNHKKSLTWLYDNIMQGLRTHRPRYLIQTHHHLAIKELEVQSGLHYTLEKVWCNMFALYRLCDGQDEQEGSYSPSWSEVEKQDAINRLCSGGEFYCGLLPEYLQNHAYREGLKECERALSLFPSDVQNRIYRIRLYDASGEYEAALKEFEGLQEGKLTFLERISLMLVKGELYRKEGEFSYARREFQRVIQLTSSKLGRFCFLSAQEEKYCREFRFSAFFHSGSLEREQEHLNEAIGYFAAAESIAEKEGIPHASLLLHLGYCYEALGKDVLLSLLAERLEGAGEEQDDDTLFASGSLYRMTKQPERAVSVLKQLYARNRQYPGLALEYALSLDMNKQKEEAIRLLHEATEEAPRGEQRGKLYLQLGITERGCGRYKEAYDAFCRAKEELFKTPQRYLSLYQSASALKCLKRFSEASDEFRSLARDTSVPEPFRSNSCFHLGAVCKEEENPDEAEKWLKQCLELNPHHEKACCLLKDIYEESMSGREKGYSFTTITGGYRDDLLEQLFDSIHRMNIPHYEIIVTGNYREREGIRYIPAPELAANAEVCKMRNMGCKAARYDKILVLDDDVEFTPDWYEKIKNFTDFDMTGCRGIDPDGNRWYDYNWADRRNVLAPTKMIPYDVYNDGVYISGFFQMFKAYVWERVKYDEGRRNYQHDDVDFCHRVIDAGFRISVFPEATVIHHVDTRGRAVSEEALQEFEESLFTPFEKLYRAGLDAYRNAGFCEAQSLLQQALEEEENCRGFYALGLVQQKLCNLDAAALSYRSALDILEDNDEEWIDFDPASLHLHIGEIAKAQGKYEEARIAFNRVLSLNAEHILAKACLRDLNGAGQTGEVQH